MREFVREGKVRMRGCGGKLMERRRRRETSQLSLEEGDRFPFASSQCSLSLIAFLSPFERGDSRESISELAKVVKIAAARLGRVVLFFFALTHRCRVCRRRRAGDDHRGCPAGVGADRRRREPLGAQRRGKVHRGERERVEGGRRKSCLLETKKGRE